MAEKKPELPKDDPAQSKRFIEAARKAELMKRKRGRMGRSGKLFLQSSCRESLT
jgi:hypothetical protein